VPTKCIYVLCICVSEQTATFAPYSANRLVFFFVTETQNAYCIVRNGSLIKILLFVHNGVNMVLGIQKENSSPLCFSLCTCFSLLHLYIPNTVDTLSLALRMTTTANWLKEQFCNFVYLAEFSVQ